MRPVYTMSAFLFTAFLWSGCGDGGTPGTVGNDSSLVGGPCMNNSECDQRLCEDSSRFPGGTCTISCGNAGQCPAGSSCGELESGWVCLVRCQDTLQCRQGYVCEPIVVAGTNQAASVSLCIGPA